MNLEVLHSKPAGSLFVYGTLLIPELLKTLLGKTLNSIPATLDNHSVSTAIYNGVETDYPFLIKETNHQANGKILLGLTFYDMQLLSFYESDEYELTDVLVKAQSGVIPVKTFYPIINLSKIKGNPWDIEKFIQKSLAKYLSEVIPQTIKEFINSSQPQP